MKITNTYIKSLQPTEAQRRIHCGDGLYVIVAPTGRKTWYARYQLRHRARWLRLGRYPAMSLAQARAANVAATERVESARLGGDMDPAESMRYGRASSLVEPTVSQLAERWIAARKADGVVKASEYGRILRKDVLPHVGTLKARRVSRAALLAILDAKKRAAPAGAREALKVIRMMFSWALEREIVEVSPCAGIKQPAEYVPRERALNDEELAAFLQFGLPGAKAMQMLLQFVLLTACRPGEARLLEWRDLRLTKALWILPAEKIKTRKSSPRDFIIPLSPQALALIERAKKCAQSDYVFASPAGTQFNKSAPDHAVARAREALQALGVAPFTPHDLRRTAATHVSAAGTPRHVVDRILNHVDQSTTGIYDVHDYLPERRAALEAWADKLDRLRAPKQS